ncbi:hypothetical protein RJ55_02331 [Drechmeria coniospora]|nr:hypothetical protein RJ55_02331 [Drechmeria coniospora]
MVCPVTRAVSLLKFVGTVSLGLLTGVSYTVSTLTLPTLLRLPSSTSASAAISSLTAALRSPVLALTALSSAPLFLSFVLSPRSVRHPYLLYTSLLAVLSTAAPRLLSPSTTCPSGRYQQAPKKASSRAPRMDSSYEVLGDVHSEATSEEDMENVNGEDVRAEVETFAKAYVVRTGLAAVGFAMAVLGLWGDGSPQAVVYIS